MTGSALEKETMKQTEWTRLFTGHVNRKFSLDFYANRRPLPHKAGSIAIVLALSSGAAAADCTFSNTVWDTGAVSSCTGTITITTSQNGGFAPIQGHGLYANNSTWNLTGKTLNITTSGVQADAIRTNGNATITLGDGLTVFTSGLSADAINLTKESSATLNIGNDANLTTTASSFLTLAEGAHVVRANNSTNVGINTINVGSNAWITTRGNNSWGVLAGLGTQEISDSNIANKGSSKITIGSDAIIKTEGTGAYGVYGNTRRSSIILGDDLTVITNAVNKGGSGSHGVYATNGAAIELQGSANINVNPVNSYAILAGREASVKSTDFDADDNLGSANVYLVNGTIRADRSKIKDSTDNGAYLSLNDQGGVVQLRMGGSSVLSRSDWDAGQSKYVLEANNTAVDAGEVGVNPSDAQIDIKAYNATAITGDLAARNGAQLNLALNDQATLKGASISTGALNIAMNGAQTQWNVTQSGVTSALSGAMHASAVNSLVLQNNAQVILGAGNYSVTDENDRVQLDVANLSGSGQFTIRPYITGIGTTAANLGDLLNITDSTAGNHSVYIPSAELGLGSVVVDGTEELKVVQTADGNGSFTLKDRQAVDIGHLKYKLSQEDGQNWYLVAEGDEPVNPADVSANFLNVNYLMTYVDTQTLLQRMGALRHTRQGDAWIRAFSGHLNSFSDRLLSGFKMDYHGIQAGVDRRIDVGDSEFFLGGMLGYTKANPHHHYGTSSADNYHVGIYATYGTEDDFYVDGLVKYVRMKNKFNVRDSQDAAVHGNGSSSGWGMSLETGKRFYLQKSLEGFYLEPQAQISHSRQGELGITASNGLRVDMDAYKSTLLRFSMLMGYNVKSSDTPFHVYLKTGYVRELDGKVDIHYNRAATERYAFNKGWWDNGIGVTAEIRKQHNLYFEASYAKGDKFDKKQFGMGYRYAF